MKQTAEDLELKDMAPTANLVDSLLMPSRLSHQLSSTITAWKDDDGTHQPLVAKCTVTEAPGIQYTVLNTVSPEAFRHKVILSNTERTCRTTAAYRQAFAKSSRRIFRTKGGREHQNIETIETVSVRSLREAPRRCHSVAKEKQSQRNRKQENVMRFY